jgi:hypothetical protein
MQKTHAAEALLRSLSALGDGVPNPHRVEALRRGIQMISMMIKNSESSCADHTLAMDGLEEHQ